VLEAQGQLESPEKEKVACCLTTVAASLQKIAKKVDVSAICKVDKDSGLPEYPIKGKIVFIQSVTSRSISSHTKVLPFPDLYVVRARERQIETLLQRKFV